MKSRYNTKVGITATIQNFECCFSAKTGTRIDTIKSHAHDGSMNFVMFISAYGGTLAIVILTREPGYNHWIAWNITPTECIPGGIAKGSVIENPIHIEQGIAYGKHCYRGPKPPFNWNHEYLFTLYTLDCTLEANEKSKKEDILKLAEGHILQKAELRGRYQRKHQ